MFLNEEKNNKLKKAATIASVSVAVSLTIMKMAAAFYTGSLAILSSLIDSLADIFPIQYRAPTPQNRVPGNKQT